MPDAPGTVYLVGAGPGDPGLLTLRGRELLERADVVLYDALVDEALLGYAPRAEHVFVGKRPGQHSIAQEDLNALLVEHARRGRLVVRLKGGDPFVFGRGGEEAAECAAQGVPFEVVPGITAGIAGPAYAGIPVSHRGLATSLSIITGHQDPARGGQHADLSALAREGTLVFYMGVKNLPGIVADLLALGRPSTTPAALVEWGTLPRQRTVTGTLDTIGAAAEEHGIRPPSIFIVGEVVSLRDTLNWFEQRPLFGLRVAVTRSRTQASELVDRLRRLGADLFEFPTIAIEPAPPPEDLGDFHNVDWVVLTSVNGAEAVTGELARRGLDGRALAGVRLCAIGSATERALRERFLAPDLVPATYDAEQLLAALRAVEPDLAGKRILLPRSDIAHRFLPDALREAGAEVVEWVAYRTVQPPDAAERADDLVTFAPDLVTFTSSSTVANFCDALGEDRLAAVREEAAFASIGPVTSKTARERGFAVAVEPAQHDIPSLVEAIRAWHEARTRH